jgi:hypothetical protein
MIYTNASEKSFVIWSRLGRVKVPGRELSKGPKKLDICLGPA